MALIANLWNLSDLVKEAFTDAGYVRCSDIARFAALSPSCSAAAPPVADSSGMTALRAECEAAAVKVRLPMAAVIRAAQTALAALEQGNATATVNSAEDDDDAATSHGAATQVLLPFGESAAALLEQLQAREMIPTFSQHLDAMLGGGVPAGSVTEFCGLPGAGKTQLCLQLAVSARLPVSFGGLAAQTLYIDTEGSFMAARLREMAAGAVAHLQLLCHQQQALDAATSAQFARVIADFTVDAVLDAVLVHRVQDATDLMAIVTCLPDILAARPEIRFVVVDSVAFPLRATNFALLPGGGIGAAGGGGSWEAHARRTRLAIAISRRLHALAESGRIAVVVTNHMTPSGSGGMDTAP